MDRKLCIILSYFLLKCIDRNEPGGIFLVAFGPMVFASKKGLIPMSYEKLRTVQNRFEAELLSAALERSGVDFFLRTFEDTAYDGLFVAQEGWGVIWVAPEDRQVAADIIQKFDEAYATGFEGEIEAE
jgi:hypothetical protein